MLSIISAFFQTKIYRAEELPVGLKNSFYRAFAVSAIKYSVLTGKSRFNFLKLKSRN
jgi:hypothetical protein